MALAGALCVSLPAVTGFTNASLRALVAGRLGAEEVPEALIILTAPSSRHKVFPFHLCTQWGPTLPRPHNSAAPVTASVPFYLPQGDEIEVFEAAYRERLPVLLKGPTGCGKTRFLEHVAARVSRDRGWLPLTTVACHEDLTVGDLVGRHLLAADETVWVDGPLTQAVRQGGICYLDEIVEARKDTTVLIHALTDHRRMLPIEKLSTSVDAHQHFQLVISYNPGYQSALKDLKPSTRQRFVAIDFDYPSPDVERAVLEGEAGAERDLSERLVALGNQIRQLADTAHLEGPSTRLLVYAAQLVSQGISPQRACESAISSVLTDEPDVIDTLKQLVIAQFGERRA